MKDKQNDGKHKGNTIGSIPVNSAQLIFGGILPSNQQYRRIETAQQAILAIIKKINIVNALPNWKETIERKVAACRDLKILDHMLAQLSILDTSEFKSTAPQEVRDDIWTRTIDSFITCASDDETLSGLDETFSRFCKNCLVAHDAYKLTNRDIVCKALKIAIPVYHTIIWDTILSCKKNRYLARFFSLLAKNNISEYQIWANITLNAASIIAPDDSYYSCNESCTAWGYLLGAANKAKIKPELKNTILITLSECKDPYTISRVAANFNILTLAGIADEAIWQTVSRYDYFYQQEQNYLYTEQLAQLKQQKKISEDIHDTLLAVNMFVNHMMSDDLRAGNYWELYTHTLKKIVFSCNPKLIAACNDCWGLLMEYNISDPVIWAQIFDWISSEKNYSSYPESLRRVLHITQEANLSKEVITLILGRITDVLQDSGALDKLYKRFEILKQDQISDGAIWEAISDCRRSIRDIFNDSETRSPISNLNQDNNDTYNKLSGLDNPVKCVVS